LTPTTLTYVVITKAQQLSAVIKAIAS
ncbi:hypothetical protein CWATWH0003_4829b4, partial [Crocosphaera watsonii WH 0003]